MKKIKIYKFILIAFLVGLFSCEDYVTSVDPFINLVEDKVLDKEDQVPFLVIGVQNAAAFAIDDLFIAADGLSDQLIFDRKVRNATFPTYEEIDKGEIQPDNNSIDACYPGMHRFRLYADTLIARVDRITFNNQTTKNTGYYTGYLYGGLARFYSATYFGLTKTQPGDALNKSPIISPAALYDQAIAKWKTGLTYATAAQKRVLNSLIARAYLFKGDYANAATYAANGMIKGDPVFEAKYSTISDNNYRVQAGELRSQFVLAQRMVNYVTADPNEAKRVQFKKASLAAGQTGDFYYQYKYRLDGTTGTVTGIPLMNWQENNLMRAELILRGAATGDALALVNEVRANYGIAPLTEITLDDPNKPSIYVERDKELMCQGARLPDQRRFNKWHIPGSWMWLPITDDERNENPNF